MAAKAVAETAELLESILVHLSMEELLLAQAVSRTWKDLVETSPTLKLATFRPDAAAPVDMQTGEDGKYVSSFFPTMLADGSVSLNPIFSFKSLEQALYQTWTTPPVKGRTLTGHRFFFTSTAAFGNVTRSVLRETYITLPPCTTMHLYIGSYDGE